MSLPKKLLSIDIGNEQIKIVYAKQSKNKVSVMKHLLIPTPTDAIRDGGLLNKEAVKDTIKNALLTEKIKEKNVVFVISSSKVITREVDLPYMKTSKLENMIRLNSDDYFPVNLAEYNLDFIVSEVIETEEGKRAKVIIYAALSVLINSYVELAEMLGLKIQSIDYSGNSLVSFVQLAKLKGTNLILDIGSESTMVTIMSNNTVKFSRNILFGTRTINQSIQRHFDVDYNEATKIAKERQLLSVDRQENMYLTTDVTGTMDQILNGVSRLVDYYASRNKNGVENIYLLGGGSEIHGIVPYVEKFFGLKCSKFEAPSGLSFSKNSGLGEQIVFFPCAIGGARDSVNLLPLEVKEKDIQASKKRIPILFSLLVLLGVGALYYSKLIEYNDLKDRKLSVENEIENLAVVNEIITELETTKVMYSFRKSLADVSTTRSDELLGLIEGWEATMPEQVYFRSIAVSDSGLTFEVVAKTEGTVAQLLTYMKNINTIDDEGNAIPLFDSVYTSTISQIGEGADSQINISLSCDFYTGGEE